MSSSATADNLLPSLSVSVSSTTYLSPGLSTSEKYQMYIDIKILLIYESMISKYY